jgi:hypothetical protein
MTAPQRNALLEIATAVAASNATTGQEDGTAERRQTRTDGTRGAPIPAGRVRP